MSFQLGAVDPSINRRSEARNPSEMVRSPDGKDSFYTLVSSLSRATRVILLTPLIDANHQDADASSPGHPTRNH
jgi:hypothetical protein